MATPPTKINSKNPRLRTAPYTPTSPCGYCCDVDAGTRCIFFDVIGTHINANFTPLYDDPSIQPPINAGTRGVCRRNPGTLSDNSYGVPAVVIKDSSTPSEKDPTWCGEYKETRL